MKSGINIRPLQPVMLQQTLSDQGGTHLIMEYGASFPIIKQYLNRRINDDKLRSRQ